MDPVWVQARQRWHGFAADWDWLAFSRRKLLYQRCRLCTRLRSRVCTLYEDSCDADAKRSTKPETSWSPCVVKTLACRALLCSRKQRTRASAEEALRKASKSRNTFTENVLKEIVLLSLLLCPCVPHSQKQMTTGLWGERAPWCCCAWSKVPWHLML